MQLDHEITIIALKNIRFAYGRDIILQNVSLNIHRGDYLGIIGPNGGGKTTLVKIMLGLLKPSHGEVLLFDRPLTGFHDWSKIGYVPQKAINFDPSFPATAFEVVMMGRIGTRGIGRRLTDIDHQKTREALKKVEMLPFANRLIGSLSGGQQQRVLIARALASEPEVIILDEPTTGVDEQTQTEFYRLLRNLNRKHDLTLVLISHDSNIIEREATEIATVNKTVKYITNYVRA